MIGEALDALIEPFSPAWAYRRRHFRASMELVRPRSISSGSRIDPKRRWSQMGPVSRTQNQYKERRAQARELYRENPYARGAINAIVANLVCKGIHPQPRVLRPKKRDLDEPINDRLRAVWDRWARKCDVQGQTSYYALQRRAVREWYVTGEVILHLPTPRRDDPRELPLAVDLIPSERLALEVDNRDRRRARVVQGVEVDAVGTPLAYWIYPQHPDESDFRLNKQNQPRRVPASEIIHLYDPTEPGQVRGETKLLSVSRTFEAMEQWLDFVLTKERVAASWVAMLRKEFGGATFRGLHDADVSETDDDGNQEDLIEGGTLLHGRPGEDIKSVSSGVIASQVDHLASLFLRQIARGLDVSYELISGDMSKVTYLSARQGQIQNVRIWEPQQEEFNVINESVWERFVDQADRAGLLGAQASDERLRSMKEDVLWAPPGWDWVDPSKDTEAATLAIQAGLESSQKLVAKRGGDAIKILEDNAQHKKWSEDMGLGLSIYKEEPEPPAPPAPAAASAAAATNGNRRFNGEEAANT